MSDSLVLANSIELLQGDEGGELSTLPGLMNTTFALNDGQGTYSLGSPNPTVDILASLITDGERPQGRRASNRVLSLPVAIVSDTRDNLALARETLLQLVDAQETERFTLTYTRDGTTSSVGPLILDCWRAEATDIAYSVTEEAQFCCELVLSFEALPYGRSDTPNQVSFLNAASGSSAPATPITLDLFNALPQGMAGIWKETSAAVNGGYAAYCPSPNNNQQVTTPLYVNQNIGIIDLTNGTGLPVLNVIQFWAGFASQAYFNNWANHKSEVRFIVTLYDVNGQIVQASRQNTVAESNSYANPKYHNIQVRMPVTQNSAFLWSQVVGFSIKIQNFHDGNLHNSNVFLDNCNAISQSMAVANHTRGSIYKVNGVEGTVHTPVSLVAQQQASTSPTTATLAAGTASWQNPAGVTQGTIEAYGPGGNGGFVTATAYGGGGGGGEYARGVASLTPGNVYTPVIPHGLGSQTLGAFSNAFTQCAQLNSSGPNISNPSAVFTASVAAGNTVIFTVIAPPGANLVSSWSCNDIVNGNYTLLESSSAPDGTQVAVYAFFNSAALTTSNAFTITGLTSPTSIEIVAYYAPGLYGYLPTASAAGSGTSRIPSAVVPGFLNTNPKASDTVKSYTYQFGYSSPTSVTNWNITANFGAERINDGDTCFAQIVSSTGQITGVTDTQGNAYTILGTYPNNDNTAFETLAVAYNCLSLGASDTVGVTSAVSDNFMSSVYGFHNMGVLSAIGSNIGTGATASASISGMNTTDALVAITFSLGHNGNTPTGFTTIGGNSGNGYNSDLSWIPQSNLTSLSETTSGMGSPGDWGMILVAFQQIAPQTNYWASYNSSNVALTPNPAPASGAPVECTLDLSTTASGTQPAIVNNGYAPVTTNELYAVRLFSYMASQTDMKINLILTWYDATHTQISANAAQVTKSAGVWEWSTAGTAYTAPSNARYVQATAQVNTSTTTTVLSIAALGVVQYGYQSPVQLAVMANNSAKSTGSAPGSWNHLYGSTSETPLCNDIFWSLGGNTAWGGDLCAGSPYSSSVPWASVTVTLSRAATQTVFPADNITVVANGGTGVPGQVSTGGIGGFGSLSSVHSPGGTGANGVSTNGGGGGSSAGSGGAASFVDDTSATMVYSYGHMLPPTLITSGIPESRATWNAGNGVYTYGSQVIQYGARTGDTLLAIVISDNTSNDPCYVTDSTNNSWNYIWRESMADGREMYAFYARDGNQRDGVLNTVSVGQDVWVSNASQAGDYAIFVYLMPNVTGITGDVYSAGAGTDNYNFTGTSGSHTTSGIGTNSQYPKKGHVVFSMNETNQIGGMAPTQNGVADSEDFSTVVRHDGTSWTNTGQHIDVFYKDADGSGSSTTFNFTLPSSAEMDSLITTWYLSNQSWTVNAAGNPAQYTNGTHHYTNAGGQKVVISFSGSQAQIIGVQGPNQGQMLVSVDSGPYVMMDNYSSNYQYKSVLYDTGLLANTTHTIAVLTTALHDTSSTNSYIDIDGYQILSQGLGIAGAGVTGATAPTGGGSGGNGGATNVNGSNGTTPGGGGGGAASNSGTRNGGNAGNGRILVTYYSTLPAFKTLILHRPSLDGSKTLLPYISCATTAVPTNDQVQPIDAGTVPQFQGTYSMMVAGLNWNNPTASRTVTVTVNECERLGGAVTSSQATSRTIIPSTDAINSIVTIGELTLPNKDIPPENNNAVYFVSVNSSNTSDTIQDVMMMDTMGQTVWVNEATAYSQFFLDEPPPDRDIGRVLASQFDRPYAISCLDEAFPTGGPLTLEPGDNLLFAYCYEGAPALSASYFPRYYIDRTIS
jgi:hypothetical protein